MSDDDKGIAWATVQIKEMVNKFEGKKLPDWAVGAIHGYCDRIVREALSMRSITVELPKAQKTL